jgi:hypothetical protein
LFKLPVTTCTTCGQHYFVHFVEHFVFTDRRPGGGEAVEGRLIWRARSEAHGGSRVVLLDGLVVYDDDDPAAVPGIPRNSVPLFFCRHCGALHPFQMTRCDACGLPNSLVQLFAVRQKAARAGRLTSCVGCGAIGRQMASGYREPSRPVRALAPEVWRVERKEAAGHRHAAERRRFLRIQVIREIGTGQRQRIGLEPWGRFVVEYFGLEPSLPFFQLWAARIGTTPEKLRDGVAGLLDSARRSRILYDPESRIFSRFWREGDREVQNGYIPYFDAPPVGLRLNGQATTYVKIWLSASGRTLAYHAARRWGLTSADIPDFYEQLWQLLTAELGLFVADTLRNGRGNRIPDTDGAVQVNRALTVSDVHVLAQSMVHHADHRRLLVFTDNRQPPNFNLRNDVMVRKHVHAAVMTVFYAAARGTAMDEPARLEIRRALDTCFPQQIRDYLFLDTGDVRREEFNLEPFRDILSRHRAMLSQNVARIFAQSWPSEDADVVASEVLDAYVIGMEQELASVLQRLRRRLQWALDQLDRLDRERRRRGTLDPEEDSLRERCDRLIKRLT